MGCAASPTSLTATPSSTVTCQAQVSGQSWGQAPRTIVDGAGAMVAMEAHPFDRAAVSPPGWTGAPPYYPLHTGRQRNVANDRLMSESAHRFSPRVPGQIDVAKSPQ